ncbi:hypothetical protein EJ08DRAFT_271424 [Tothia fuscella]|uniref:BTB domain-containing protein n=1 Tax=Tothia fuscella TaxID=1048955 RepID=A0A9P4TWU5_9PEZI|nr:hypothetical protein EJ08DRAFT_271424 [Tothia fuscella]
MANPNEFLRYPDGDVIISLSKTGQDLVLHSSVLCKYSEWFANSLKGVWISNKIAGTKVVQGKEIQMKRCELENDEGIFLLMGKVSVISSLGNIIIV